MNLTFDHVHKQFGDLPVVEGFSSEFKTGELVALVGPSGCGKSTLLHLAAGLEAPAGPGAGRRQARGRSASQPHPGVPGTCAVSWLTLQDNVALALEFQNIPKARARDGARDWLARVGLGGFEKYYPHQVSGGMRQRAAGAPSSPSRRPC